MVGFTMNSKRKFISFYSLCKKKISLLPHQLIHAKKIIKIFRNGEQFYIDCSLMGAGKTFVSLYFAQVYNLPLFIICPKSMINTWQNVAKEYSIEIVYITTYQSLRGTSKGLNHKYLSRQELPIKVGNKIKLEPTFTFTNKFKKLANKGVFLILDEIQYVKNNTAQSKAASALSKALLGSNKSKMALLSATPFDKPECAENIIRLSNCIKSDKLYSCEDFGRNFQPIGLQELIDKCETVSQVKTKTIVNSYSMNAKNSRKICYELFINVLKDKFVSIMQAPEINAEYDVKNGHYELTEHRITSMTEAIENLIISCRYSRTSDSIQTTGPVDMGGITKAMREIETIKIDIVKRLALQRLIENSNSKVIIYVSYNSNIKILSHILARYSPLVLNGDTSIINRKIIIDSFQSYSNQVRVLIANIKVGGIGIDLHDTHGNYPRYMFIVPTFSILDLHQACGRIYRHGTKSKATIRFIYSKLNELKVIDAIAKKTIVLRNVATNENSSVLFPGEYLKYIEELPRYSVRDSVRDSDSEEAHSSHLVHSSPPPSYNDAISNLKIL